MRTVFLTMMLAFSCGAATLAGDGWFVPGRVFIEELEPEACHLPEANNWLVAVDPETGEAWDVVGREDGLCNNNGLAFAADGRTLRILNLGRNNILQLEDDGQLTVLYAGPDGLGGPFGRNGCAWDDLGSFYVANEYTAQILRFPASGGPAHILTDVADALSGGALACARDGTLFYADLDIWQVSQSGDVTRFDTPPPNRFARSIAFDRSGTLFVAFSGHLYRYDAADPATRRLLATGFVTPGGDVAIAMSPDDAYVYVSDADSLWAVDALSGERRLIYDTPWPRSSGRGIAVYDPPRPGDVNCDRRIDNGDIDAFVLALTDPDAYAAQFSWCRRDLADVNGDTFIDAADIDPFVARLIGE